MYPISINVGAVGAAEIRQAKVAVIVLYYLTMMPTNLAVVNSNVVLRTSSYSDDFHR